MWMTFFSKNKVSGLIVVLFICQIPIWGKEARPLTVKLATLAPDGSPWHELLVVMGQEWERATEGNVAVRIYPDGVAGDERDMIRKIRIGQIHAAAVTIEGLTEISRDMNVFFIPLLVDSFEELDEIRNAMAPELSSELEEKGFKLLLWADVGWAYWFTREPIGTPEDLQKLRLFTWAGDYRWAELWKTAGFRPVPLASIDVLTSLQTGLIDAFATTPMVALSLQWFALAPHMLDLKWGPMTGAVIISNEMWSAIPGEYHPELLRIADQMEKRAREIVPQVEQALHVMEEHGLKIHHTTVAQRSRWVEFTRSFYPHLRGTFIPADAFDRAIQLKEKLSGEKEVGN